MAVVVCVLNSILVFVCSAEDSSLDVDDDDENQPLISKGTK